VREGWQRWPGATPDESIDIMLTLDALAASIRDGTPSRWADETRAMNSRDDRRAAAYRSALADYLRFFDDKRSPTTRAGRFCYRYFPSSPSPLSV
jgi:hypothetical protein